MEQELLNFKWLSSFKMNLARFHKKFEIKLTSTSIAMDDLTWGWIYLGQWHNDPLKKEVANDGPN
jgi:hypothetical protein